LQKKEEKHLENWDIKCSINPIVNVSSEIRFAWTNDWVGSSKWWSR